jgi:hypothetical protein
MKLPPVGAPTWTEADDAKLRSLAMAGLSSREIAMELNRSLNAVRATGDFAEASDVQATPVEPGSP